MPAHSPPPSDEAHTPIVSSAHLVSSKSPELSEFEFGLIIATHAFQRWMVRCMGAAGVKDMTAVDVMVLHHINHRGSDKRLGTSPCANHSMHIFTCKGY